MQAFIECIPCIVRQTVEVAQMATADNGLRLAAVRAALRLLADVDPLKATAPELTALIHRQLEKLLGTEDLYQVVKIKENQQALDLYPQVEQLVEDADDRLEMALRVAILGNVIDYGAMIRFDLKDVLSKITTLKFGIYDFPQFKADVMANKKILYVGDNTGEIVFDKILVKELLALGCEVVYAVKSRPILNDVTMVDAEVAGLCGLVEVIKSGSTTPGTLLAEASPEFLKAYARADFLIAKGQGNLETLDNIDKSVYFLLKMKCPYLARELRVETGDLVLRYDI
ncbi:DUF89 domain-containing protein [Candidatus Margulisiibacteriota bacterium]